MIKVNVYNRESKENKPEYNGLLINPKYIVSIQPINGMYSSAIIRMSHTETTIWVKEDEGTVLSKIKDSNDGIISY